MNQCTPGVLTLLIIASIASAETKAPGFPPLPKAVSSFGAATADGYLYVYGGHSGKAHTYSTDTVQGTFHRLKLAEPIAWEELPGGPALQGLAFVAHRGKLYRIGGMQPRNKPDEKSDNHSVTSCACYDPATKKWADIAELPAGRSSHDAVVIGDRIYVVGGWKMAGGSKPVWHDAALFLDLSSKTSRWESVSQPFRRRALTAASFEGKVHVIAGMTEENEMELCVDVFDPVKKTWTMRPSIPGPIANGFTPASAVAGNRLFVSTADGKIWRLTEDAKSWDEVGELKRPRFVHRMVAGGDELLIAVGGASRQGNVDLTEAIIPDCCARPKTTPTANPSGQTVCPVMIAVPVGSEAKVVEYKGVKVQLCCAACVKKWEADPTAYLDAKRLPQLAKLDLPPRSIKQIYCPVYRDRVVSEKDPFVMYKGQKVYLFNQAAVRKWEANPEAFVDAEILPQLAGR